jgi:elongation factor P
MVTSNNIAAGMILSINETLYRVESCVKVNVPKGTPFIKAKLRNLVTNEVTERNFKLNQNVQDVTLSERRLEYLYMEGKNYLFLDIGNLEKVSVPSSVVAANVNYLKEGVDVKAFFYGTQVFSIELPQFLELMVSKIEEQEGRSSQANSSRQAVLETGAKVEVPRFVEVGDIIKVDTAGDEYIQRV